MAQLLLRLSCCARSKKSKANLQWSCESFPLIFKHRRKQIRPERASTLLAFFPFFSQPSPPPPLLALVFLPLAPRARARAAPPWRRANKKNRPIGDSRWGGALRIKAKVLRKPTLGRLRFGAAHGAPESGSAPWERSSSSLAWAKVRSVMVSPAIMRASSIALSSPAR